MILEMIALILAWLVVTLFVCALIYVGKSFIVGLYKILTCQHINVQRCSGDARNYADRRCLDCGKGFH